MDLSIKKSNPTKIVIGVGFVLISILFIIGIYYFGVNKGPIFIGQVMPKQICPAKITFSMRMIIDMTKTKTIRPTTAA